MGKGFYEIGSVEFEENDSYGDGELLKSIKVRPSARGIIHSVMQMYYDEGRKNPYTPKLILDAIKKNLDWLSNELRYFNEKSTDNDALSLRNFYNKNGWHDAQVSYVFAPDSFSRTNILTFYINEGPRYFIDTVAYKGLEMLDSNVYKQLVRYMTIEKGDDFDEEEIAVQVGKIKEELLNNGYYFAQVETPRVVKDLYSATDSIEIRFKPGKRYRVGKISYKDFNRDQTRLTDKTKSNFLTLKEGEWVRHLDVTDSRSRLLELGLFESVYLEPVRTETIETDTVLNFVLTTYYVKQQSWSGGIYFNETDYDNLYNIGVEGEYSHKNLFGAAQFIKPSAKIGVKDVERIVKNFYGVLTREYKDFDYEVQTGFSFVQPDLFWIGNSQFNMSFTPNYSYRTLYNLFKLGSVNIPFKFYMRPPFYVFFNQISFDLAFDYQKPSEFDNILKDSSAGSGRLIEATILYQNLNNSDKVPTAVLFGVSLLSDKRNNFLSPTNGHLLNIQLFEAAPGIGLSNYVRTQFAGTIYRPWLAEGLTVAGKFRWGFTWLGKSVSENYVPLEKQFFAGGANSVRGWDSRRLRYTSKQFATDTPDEVILKSFIEDYVGSQGLIETSIELRYRLPRPEYFDDFWAEQISSLSIVGFLDAGNSFDWLAETDDVDFFKYFYRPDKLAVSTGAGIRYDTPVGPIRIDIACPVYDPMGTLDPAVFKRLKLHFGLGHAF